jgi:hypothetical protein
MMTKVSPSSEPGRQGWTRAATRHVGIVVLATVLAGVFLLYWHPDLAFDLATKLWSCF